MLADVELLERLVGFDTTSHRSNLPLLDFVCDYADGAAIHRHPSPDGEKANVVISFGPGGAPDRAGLVLSGHMDVVPAGEPQWESDPFALRDDGERLFGRGSADMKGFLALALNVALEALETRDLRAPLVLLFTYDEEVGTLGARHFVENGPAPEALPRSCIIGEPTSLRVVRMHKGHLKMRVEIEGVSAHSGYPHLGRNAIEGAGEAIAALVALREELEREGGPHLEFFPEVPFVPLNLGTIHGGSAVNVVPDRCVIEIGARLLPGMERAPLEERVRAAVAPHRFESTGESPPLLLDAGARVHRELCDLVGQPGEHAVSFATDGGWFQETGMECAIFGPGAIEVAHKPNEFVPRDELRRARTVLEQMVERMCR